ncbi:acetyl-coenzyme A synthetase N-terminal domain-containing protein [Defluviimonas salinarum]|uniref:Acetyl-coenzyme A synthetase N-terminal domain-containing protein n=1 Tax=Defluviimonas salinarum TaxID=2992147 RepID=A0ABT3JAT9_9RHOB|nr:acetyl-coenzyme A synthetase N-terminal domain-containing protein [Defluviimonas salinarum]MCW3784807.1 hypothetical protein [Defluviimonas salinarum]
MGRFLWQAEPERAAAASITRFTREVAATGREVAAYPDLHRWSVEYPEEFWPLAWDFCGLVGTQGGTAVERAEDPLGWRFFPGAKLNVVETLLNHADDRAALVAVSKAGDRTVLTRAELKAVILDVPEMRARGSTRSSPNPSARRPGHPARAAGSTG